MMFINFLIGLVTGIISGFGVGGGSLLVLYLTAIIGESQYVAGGMNLLYFIGCAPVALIGHIKQRRIEWKAVLWCTIAGLAVVIPTSILASQIDNQWMRRLFGVVLLYVGIKEWRNAKQEKH